VVHPTADCSRTFDGAANGRPGTAPARTSPPRSHRAALEPTRANGTLTAGVVTMAAGLAYIQGGTLVGIAVTSKRRARRSARCTHAGRVHRARLHPPDLAGPAGSSATPDAVVARLHAAVVQALKHPAVVERLPSQGFYAEGESGATFGALLDSSYLSFEAVV